MSSSDGVRNSLDNRSRHNKLIKAVLMELATLLITGLMELATRLITGLVTIN